MAKPNIHAISSAKRYGGVMEDYLDIHQLMDSSKSCLADNRHRTLTHNSWFVNSILPKIFGETRVNSSGKTYNVKDVGEQHCLEDFNMQFIPSASDYLNEVEMKPWMNNGRGNKPPSCNKLILGRNNND